MIQNSIKIVKSCVIWYIFRWAGGRVTRGGCVDGWVGAGKTLTPHLSGATKGGLAKGGQAY